MPTDARLQRLLKSLRSQDLEAAFLTNLTNIRYLTGFTGSSASLLVTDEKAHFFTDGRYIAQAGEEVSGADVKIYLSEAEYKDAVSRSATGLERIGIEAATVTLAQQETFYSFFPGSELVPVPKLVEEVRRVKDSEELTAVTEAARIADEALEHIFEKVEVGKTERELALDLEFYMRTHGAEDVSFEIIVASGGRSALPHARPTDAQIENDRYLLFDIGCVYQGYCSDITRTVVVGSADERHRQVYEAVLEAQLAGLGVLGPGVACSEVDQVSRTALEAGGMAGAFTHGLGHGVGLEIHEAPTLKSSSDDVLVAGDVVTIEPGAYFPGWGGVRIEDLVVITSDGYEILSKSPKDLRIL